MNQSDETPTYRVWGADCIAYGPVELPTLVSWIKDGRVLADTWLFLDQVMSWLRAAEVLELRMFFRDRPAGAPRTSSQMQRVTAGALRRIKILADMEERALESLLRYMEPLEVRIFTTVVREGDPADAIYFLLEGEVRAFLVHEGKETILATILPGESFGEIALLDHGVRSANVAANKDSLLLRMTAANFETILREAPALAMPFALGLARALATRLRYMSKRYEDSIHFSRIVSG